MQKLKIRPAAFVLLLMTLSYVGLLIWLDRSKGLLSGFDRLYSLLPTLMFLSLMSYLARYARWYWLLARAGVSIQPAWGFVAYLTGFAFTATPGKVGELLRIRYFQPMGATPELILSAFVYERMWDLLVVLCIASIAAANFGLFSVAVVFVLLVLSAVMLLMKYTERVLLLAAYLERRNKQRLARLIEFFARGFAHTAVWINPLDLLLSLLAGGIAWGLTAYSFVLLLNCLALAVPTFLAFSLYPVAMLAGAASMMPGGIGSTEVVLIALLAGLGVNLSNGTIAAIGIRLVTLWFATLLGLLSMSLMEFLAQPNNSKMEHT